MKKRGQVTTFIIIGLIIVVIVGLLLFLSFKFSTEYSEAKRKGVQHFSMNALKLEPYIKECVYQQSVVALFDSIERTGKKTTLPPVEEIEYIISDYLERHIRDCVDFSKFKEFEVDPGRINATVNIYKEHFAVEIKWPLKIKQKDLTMTLEDFKIEFPLQLNELYLKVKSIVDANAETNVSLDLDLILGQGLNIEILGCKGNNINYLVNDNEYMLDNNILQFFFNAPINDLIGLFEFKDGIIFKPPFFTGKHVLRKQGEIKRLIFDTTKEGYIEGCYRRDRETEHYTFSLVEDNRIPAAVSRKKGKRVLIERTAVNVSSENFNLQGAFRLTAPFGFDKGTLFLLSEEKEAAIYKLEENEWKKLQTETKGNYLAAEIVETGIYSAGIPLCAPAAVSEKPDLIAVFVASDYENLSIFSSHADKHASGLLELTGLNISIYKTMKLTNIGCEAWNTTECSPAFVKQYLGPCEQEGVYADHTIVLIESGIVGLDHRTADDVSYVGSYLTDNYDYCNVCYTLYELGKSLGLNDTIANMTEVNMTGMIPVMAVNQFEPAELSYEQVYFTEQEKETIRENLEIV
ncbi:hypothetical protein GF371_02960 [Candidatus Woesearchaeota archaeon]|nr:hypothetical protein [Candidatus Woesearchaeota archaeon]